MSSVTIEQLYGKLKSALADVVEREGLRGHSVEVRCRVLEAAEAIGCPKDDDYPILRGREHMVEARFEQSRGQAFADEFQNFTAPIEDLIAMDVDTNSRRAVFIAGLNAVFRRFERCAVTVHCRDEEPRECADRLGETFPGGERVLLVGLQPRFLEALAGNNDVRAVDLDERNIGTRKFGVEIEPPEATDDAIRWCDRILATGSTIVNGSITTFLNCGKPVVFFGVTIAAAVEILGLDHYCHAPKR